MGFNRVYLDSNIFIRAFEAPQQDDIAQDLIEMLGLIRIGSPPRFVTSQMTLAELLVQPIRKGDAFMREQYSALLSRSTPWLHVPLVSRSVLVGAAEIRARSKMKLPDAIHAASAIGTGCSHILTADGDFGGLQQTVSRAPETVRPTQQTIDALIDWLRS